MEPKASVSSGAPCKSSAVEDDIPTTPIPNTEWSEVYGVAVPSTTQFGPWTKDSDGLRRCFAHSPAGAVTAAYNYLVAMSPPDEVGDEQEFSVLRRVIAAGPDREHYFDYLRSAEDQPDTGLRMQLIGFYFVTATANRAIVVLAAHVGDAYVSSRWTLEWVGDDWLVAAPKRGEVVGQPYTRISDTTGFIPWSAA
ncbi:hypothetical protein [Kribbella endophytica]